MWVNLELKTAIYSFLNHYKMLNPVTQYTHDLREFFCFFLALLSPKRLKKLITAVEDDDQLTQMLEWKNNKTCIVNKSLLKRICW